MSDRVKPTSGELLLLCDLASVLQGQYVFPLHGWDAVAQYSDAPALDGGVTVNTYRTARGQLGLQIVRTRWADGQEQTRAIQIGPDPIMEWDWRTPPTVAPTTAPPTTTAP